MTLSLYRYVCGGLTEEEVQLGQKIETYVDKTRDPNKDTCIAVAGLPENSTVQVLKYCIPKMQGQSVRVATLETWSVWHSHEWSSTIVSIQFADTVSGDSLVALRDNRGKSLESGHVLEDIVSVHPRAAQIDPALYDRYIDFLLYSLLLVFTQYLLDISWTSRH
jgi:hypothetical protein